MSAPGVLRRVGYWEEERPSDPRAPAAGRPFLAALFVLTRMFSLPLPRPQDHVDESWDAAERERVARYADAGRIVESWLGYSACRICGVAIMDCTDRSDGAYIWPGGLSHYIREHRVRPPGGFVEHALGQAGAS